MSFLVSLVAAPAAEPLTTAEAKEHCRVTSSSDDTYIARLVSAARRRCEQETGRRLITQTWDLKLSEFPNGDLLELQLSPVQSITSVKYYDGVGTQRTWASAEYELLAGSVPRLALLPSYSWPAVQIGRAMPIEIRLVCGYGNAAAVPEDLKQWMLVMISGMYEKREPIHEGQLAPVEFLDGLLDGERDLRVG